MTHIKKEFKLNCKPEQAWQLVMDRNKYEKWAAAFQAGSTYTGEMGLNETVSFVEVPDFANWLEHYLFEPEGNQTKMLVDVVMDDQYYEMMDKLWDIAGVELIKLSSD